MGIPCYRSLHKFTLTQVLQKLTSSFGNPQTLIKIYIAILNQIDPGSSFKTLCETLDLFQPPFPIHIQIFIDIACAVPTALPPSHSNSHSHFSFQVNFLILIHICYLYSLISLSNSSFQVHATAWRARLGQHWVCSLGSGGIIINIINITFIINIIIIMMIMINPGKWLVQQRGLEHRTADQAPVLCSCREVIAIIIIVLL